MLVGYVDLDKLLNLPDQDVVEVSAELTHRFTMSPRGLFQLKAQVDEITKKLKDGIDLAMATRMPTEPEDTA